MNFNNSLGALPSVAIIDDYWATSLTFAFSLGRKGVPLHFYGSGAGQFSRYRTAHAACPPVNDVARFLPWLRDKVRSGAITRIAPTTDLIAFYISSLRDEFSPAVRRAIPPLPEVEDSLLKTRFSAACRRIGQLTPEVLAPDDPEAVGEAAEEIGFPLILKPKSHLVAGAKERGRLINDVDELRLHYRKYRVAQGHEPLVARYPGLSWPLLQRYLPSGRRRVYSVTGIKDAQRGFIATSLSFKQEQWPPVVGVSTLQRSHENSNILSRGLSTVDQLISRGIFELELIDAGDNLFAIDLNPRAFGFIALDVALGRDLPWLWLRSTIDVVEPVTSPPQTTPIEARHRIVRLFNSSSRTATAGAANPVKEDEETALAGYKSISMVGHVSDPLPMLVSNFHATLSFVRYLTKRTLRAFSIDRLFRNKSTSTGP